MLTEIRSFLTVPYWSVTLLAAVPLAMPLFDRGLRAAITYEQAWRSRRRNPGLCRVCGYDLRASPDRCPECGAQRVG